MADLILTTFDWVPETPRGYVRDLLGASRNPPQPDMERETSR
jgi:hypothetical protein